MSQDRHDEASQLLNLVCAGSAAALVAVIEYLLAEVLELAGNCARDNKRKSIKPRHIMMAVEMDDELKPLFGGANVGFILKVTNCLT